MSNGKPCEAHNIPVDICARCRGAAEERERIIALLTEFAQDLLAYNLMTGKARHEQIMDAINLIKGDTL